MLARAVAKECKCTFFNFSASSLVSKYMGEAEKIMKMLFKMAYNHQPSIIYIDEIDCILTERNSNEHEASRRLKTEFLVQMDGITTSDQDRVVTIGTTNLPN
jgi:SpoVK/Ycf46/Vps4 family AAA+-type ATPase